MPGKPADRSQESGVLLGEKIHERESAALDERVRDRLAGVFLERGLVVEQLERAWSPGHEKVDDTPCPGWKMAGPDRERIGSLNQPPGVRGRRPGAAIFRSRSGRRRAPFAYKR